MKTSESGSAECRYSFGALDGGPDLPEIEVTLRLTVNAEGVPAHRQYEHVTGRVVEQLEAMSGELMEPPELDLDGD